MIYVVLGMHKSGTTLVSQTLHKSGISMGHEFNETVTYDQGNQWERRESWLINLEIVGANEPTFFSLDYYTRFGGRPTGDMANRIDALVDIASNEAEDWGFKDPLTCLTYPQWASRLPEHRVIAVYRDPGEVMRHYRCGGFDARCSWRVLRAWNQYNQGILEALESLGPRGLCLRYDALMSGDSELDRLRAFVGRDLADVRRASSYRARASHPLRGPVGRALGLITGLEPTRILNCLDVARTTYA